MFYLFASFPFITSEKDLDKNHQYHQYQVERYWNYIEETETRNDNQPIPDGFCFSEAVSRKCSSK